MKNQKIPSLVTIGILTVITVAFWIALEVYRTLTTKPAPSVSPEVLSPLNPTLDLDTLNKLQGRVYIQDVENFTLTLPSPSPTPENEIIDEVVASPSPESTVSATPTP